MTYKKILYLFFVVLCLFLPNSKYLQYIFPDYKTYLGKTITRVDFQGNSFTTTSDLFEMIRSKPGTLVTKENLNEDIKTIFKYGSFSDVYIDASTYKDGVALKYFLTERAFVKEIVFKGLDEFSEQELKDSIPLKEDEAYTDGAVATSIQLLKAKYNTKGLFNASIRVKKELLPNKKNSIKLIFLVDEGEEIKISKVIVLGATKLKASTLKKETNLEEENLFKDGTFKEELFEKAKEDIVTYMKGKGYLDAKLLEASWKIVWKNKKKDERGIEVTFKVEEGDQYYYLGYDLEWDDKSLNKETNKPLFTRKKIFSFFEYNVKHDIGSVYNLTKINADSGTINYLYSQEGYIFARVVPKKTQIILSEEELTRIANLPEQIESEKNGLDYYHLKKLRDLLKKDIKSNSHVGKKFIHTRFVIYEGQKGYIESIILKGNKKTRKKVILRELLVKEGELFNAPKVQRSRERIFNLGFFKEVNVDARPGSTEGQLNLIIDVVEQPTGNINLGGGYGTVSGFSIFVELAENNLNGTGQRLAGRLDFGPLRSLVDLSWTEPWIFNKPWSLSLNGTYSQNAYNTNSIDTSSKDAATYVFENIGFGIGTAHRFGVNWVHSHTLAPSVSRFKNPSSLADDLLYTRQQLGWQFRNALINSIAFDNRDNIRTSTQGLRTEFRVNFVGSLLGGTDHYIKYEPSAQFYWWPLDLTFWGLLRYNVLRRWRIVLEHRLSFGFTQVTGSLYNKQERRDNPYAEIDARYTLGGYESLRGWDYNDSLFPLAWRNGSSHRALFGSEIRIPLEPSILWFVLFFDGGALFEDASNAIIDEQATTDLAINGIRSSTLNKANIFNPAYFRYSWGFGFRLEIAILPIRFYLGRRLEWDPAKGFLREVPNTNWNISFGIGDYRF